MKKRIVIILVSCILLFSVVLIMQYNTKNVSSYLEEDIAVQSTPDKMIIEHEYVEYE